MNNSLFRPLLLGAMLGNPIFLFIGCVIGVAAGPDMVLPSLIIMFVALIAALVAYKLVKG